MSYRNTIYSMYNINDYALWAITGMNIITQPFSLN